MAANTGWVSVGSDHDTGQFAVESIRRWWEHVGRPAYPEADRLLITADGGGSNGSPAAAVETGTGRPGHPGVPVVSSTKSTIGCRVRAWCCPVWWVVWILRSVLSPRWTVLSRGPGGDARCVHGRGVGPASTVP
jgi:hypothetical protein